MAKVDFIRLARKTPSLQGGDVSAEGKAFLS